MYSLLVWQLNSFYPMAEELVSSSMLIQSSYSLTVGGYVSLTEVE